jgi:hypothetical protein
VSDFEIAADHCGVMFSCGVIAHSTSILQNMTAAKCTSFDFRVNSKVSQYLDS